MWNPFTSATAEDQPPATDPDASSPQTLADRRAAAAELRATTRSSSSSSSSSSSRHGHLTVPTAQQRFRNIARSRSPSPSASASAATTHFDFDPPAAVMMDEDTVKRITAQAVEFALRQDREERDRQSKIATEAAVTAALANQTNQVRALRKPELPNLDKKNIDNWIRRVENAYTRADITRAKDKFAFLETKFPQCDDATINEFLGCTTEDKWAAFKEYLRDLYGRSKKEQVYSIFNGVPQDGRRPKQYASHIKDLVGKISLDDILKELLLKEIPAEVRQHAATAIENKDFQETADYLEIYFDKSGKTLNSSNTLSINSVNSGRQQQRQQRPTQSSMKTSSAPAPRSPSNSPTRSSEANSFTTAFESDSEATDVNAVRFRPNGQRQTFDISNRSQSRGRSRQPNDSNRQQSSNGRSASRYGASSSSSGNSSGATQKKSKCCFYHNLHGKEALKCEEGCMMWSQHQSSKGRASH